MFVLSEPSNDDPIANLAELAAKLAQTSREKELMAERLLTLASQLRIVETEYLAVYQILSRILTHHDGCTTSPSGVCDVCGVQKILKDTTVHDLSVSDQGEIKHVSSQRFSLAIPDGLLTDEEKQVRFELDEKYSFLNDI